MTPEPLSQLSLSSLTRLNNTSNGRVHVLPDVVYYVFGTMLALVWVFGSSLNLLCLFVFFKTQQLHIASNILVMGLNLTDFFSCFVASSPPMVSAFHKRWIWGKKLCILQGYITCVLAITSIYILMTIAFYRYLAICRPAVGSRITGTHAYYSCGVSYLLGITWAFLPVYGWDGIGIDSSGISCDLVWRKHHDIGKTFIYFTLFFGLMVPLMVMIFCYCSIIKTLRRIHRSTVWHTDTMIGQRNLAVEKNVLKTSVLILLSFICCWMPAVVLSVVTAITGGGKVSPIIRAIPPVIIHSQGMLDPIIYVATNKRMLDATRRYFGCQRGSPPATERTSSSSTEEIEEEVQVEVAEQEHNSPSQLRGHRRATQTLGVTFRIDDESCGKSSSDTRMVTIMDKIKSSFAVMQGQSMSAFRMVRSLSMIPSEEEMQKNAYI